MLLYVKKLCNPHVDDSFLDLLKRKIRSNRNEVASLSLKLQSLRRAEQCHSKFNNNNNNNTKISVTEINANKSRRSKPKLRRC